MVQYLPIVNEHIREDVYLMSDKDKSNDEVEGTDSSRRAFLKNSGIAIGGLAVGGVFGGLLSKNESDQKNESTENKRANPNEALMFFTPDEFHATDAASERIFPKDDIGPGASDLNAAIYIDHQLASQWGVNAKDYRMGPWYKAEPTQGDQIRLLRKDLFRLGLKRLDEYSNEKHDKNFADLEDKEQDKILETFENGDGGSISGTSSANFFKLLQQLTMEGVYADPMYGGNNEMAGWSMREYPGTRTNYTKEIKSDKFNKLKPESLNNHMS